MNTLLYTQVQLDEEVIGAKEYDIVVEYRQSAPVSTDRHRKDDVMTRERPATPPLPGQYLLNDGSLDRFVESTLRCLACGKLLTDTYRGRNGGYLYRLVVLAPQAGVELEERGGSILRRTYDFLLIRERRGLKAAIAGLSILNIIGNVCPRVRAEALAFAANEREVYFIRHEEVDVMPYRQQVLVEYRAEERHVAFIGIRSKLVLPDAWQEDPWRPQTTLTVSAVPIPGLAEVAIVAKFEHICGLPHFVLPPGFTGNGVMTGAVEFAGGASATREGGWTRFRGFSKRSVVIRHFITQRVGRGRETERAATLGHFGESFLPKPCEPVILFADMSTKKMAPLLMCPALTAERERRGELKRALAEACFHPDRLGRMESVYGEDWMDSHD